MPNTTYIPTNADTLVRKVTRLVRDNPGDRSVLRHSLGKLPKEAALGVHRIVVPCLPEPCDEAAERAYYAVAALIASQPRGARDQVRPSGTPEETLVQEQRPRRNLGYSLAHAVDRGGNAKGLEGHLQLLARQDSEGLYRHLPRLILRLRGDHVRIDWGVLVHDLTRWARDPRQVAKEWAQSYYRTSERLTADKTRETKDPTGNNDKEPAS